MPSTTRLSRLQLSLELHIRVIATVVKNAYNNYAQDSNTISCISRQQNADGTWTRLVYDHKHTGQQNCTGCHLKAQKRFMNECRILSRIDGIHAAEVAHQLTLLLRDVQKHRRAWYSDNTTCFASLERDRHKSLQVLARPTVFRWMHKWDRIHYVVGKAIKEAQNIGSSLHDSILVYRARILEEQCLRDSAALRRTWVEEEGRTTISSPSLPIDDDDVEMRNAFYLEEDPMDEIEMIKGLWHTTMMRMYPPDLRADRIAMIMGREDDVPSPTVSPFRKAC